MNNLESDQFRTLKRNFGEMAFLWVKMATNKNYEVFSTDMIHRFTVWMGTTYRKIMSELDQMPEIYPPGNRTLIQLGLLHSFFGMIFPNKVAQMQKAAKRGSARQKLELEQGVLQRPSGPPAMGFQESVESFSGFEGPQRPAPQQGGGLCGRRSGAAGRFHKYQPRPHVWTAGPGHVLLAELTV